MCESRCLFNMGCHTCAAKHVLMMFVPKCIVSVWEWRWCLAEDVAKKYNLDLSALNGEVKRLAGVGNE